MADTIRAFIALDIDQPAMEELKEVQTQLKTFGADVKWVNPNHIHLTLRFLGDVEPRQLEDVQAVLRQAASQTPTITTRLTHLGGFPRIEHPRVIWVGLNDDQKRIETLVTFLEQELGKKRFKKEDRSFSAHLTIGRVRSPKNLTGLIKAIQSYPPLPDLPQHIQEIILYKSTLTPTGPIYEPLIKYPLKPKFCLR